MPPYLNNRYATFVKQFPFENSFWEGSIAICFNHAHNGWILLWISCTSFLQSTSLYISHVFDPFPKLIKWLESIADDQNPCDAPIDEEGQFKTLRVLPLENGMLDFQILYGHPLEKDIEIYFRVKVKKHQLISEFIRKFDLFLQEYYDPAQWEHGSDLPNLDLSKLREFLLVE